MKKICTIIISVCILGCLFPSAAFASENLLEDLLEKLQTLVEEEAASRDSDELPATVPLNARTLYESAAPAVVEINVADADGYVFASGTGFFLNDQGDLVTNYHVIEDGYSAEVTLANGDTYDVLYVLAYDTQIDLAVLRIGVSGNEYLTSAKEPVATGDTIYTLGSALGLTGTFSDGLVATASRVMDGVDYIQITAPISSGNSGGPLLNSQGEVVGVNTWGYVDGQNVNFAVNINELTRLDYSDPVTMRTVYAREANSSAASSSLPEFEDPDLQEWMNDSDYIEVESNDSFESADVLANDTWMAGAVEDIEDFDFFGIVLTEPAVIDAVILPYYAEDNEYILAALVDPEGNFIAYAQEEEYNDVVFLDLEAEVQDAGVYYLILCVPDEYPFDSPAYYQINASW